MSQAMTITGRNRYSLQRIQRVARLKYSLATAILSVVAFLSVVVSSTGQAASLDVQKTALQVAELEPFEVSTLNPLTHIHGIPRPAMAPTLSRNELEFRLQQEIANNYSIQQRGEEFALIDGELWRTTLGVGFGLLDNLRLDLRLPLLKHDPGVLDGLISDWHDWFGLPNGDREDRPRNDLRHYYQQGDDVAVDIRSRQQGVGDLRLSLAHSLTLADRDARISAELKLPTGNPDRLTGSGAADFSVSGMIRDGRSLSAWNIGLFGGGGLAYLGAADSSLANTQKRWIWTTHLGGGWAVTPSIQIKAQLDHHTAIHHSQIRALGTQGLQLTTGFTWLLTPTAQVDFAFSEDLVTTVTPDINLLAALRYRL